MSTLTHEAIVRALQRETDKLIITPLLSKEQIGDASVDLRLGNQFIVYKRQSIESLNPASSEYSVIHKLQARQVITFGRSFVLHPDSFSLGCTLEYVSIPTDIECQVEGRSSWARVGLQIATANSVEPMFKGCLTLELANVGTIPIHLYPGVRIAQLLLRSAQPALTKQKKNRKYYCPIGPQFSRVFRDEDYKIFAKQRLL